MRKDLPPRYYLTHFHEFLAFFESQFDGYQIDLTEVDPGDTERVKWTFTDIQGQGCGGSQGGGFGTRRPNGNGSGNCGANWQRSN